MTGREHSTPILLSQLRTASQSLNAQLFFALQSARSS